MVFPIKLEGEIISIIPMDKNVNHEEVMDTLNFILTNRSRYQNKKLLIIDPESDYQPRKDQFEQFVSIIRDLMSGVITHVALVAKQDLHYGLGRMVELQAGNHQGEFQVFRKKEKAMSWLKE